MKKNSADHIGASGIRLKARGYATNAKPGPDNHSSFAHVNSNTVKQFTAARVRKSLALKTLVSAAD